MTQEEMQEIADDIRDTLCEKGAAYRDTFAEKYEVMDMDLWAQEDEGRWFFDLLVHLEGSDLLEGETLTLQWYDWPSLYAHTTGYLKEHVKDFDLSIHMKEADY